MADICLNLTGLHVGQSAMLLSWMGKSIVECCRLQEPSCAGGRATDAGAYWYML